MNVDAVQYLIQVASHARAIWAILESGSRNQKTNTLTYFKFAPGHDKAADFEEIETSAIPPMIKRFLDNHEKKGAQAAAVVTADLKKEAGNTDGAPTFGSWGSREECAHLVFDAVLRYIEKRHGTDSYQPSRVAVHDLSEMFATMVSDLKSFKPSRGV